MSSASGKIILCGEHAVVYGQPALAIPVRDVRATATTQESEDEIWIDALDIPRRYRLSEAHPNDPLAAAVHLTLHVVGFPIQPFIISITSSIPSASGLGSGAAVCTAIVRAVAEYMHKTLSPVEVSAIVFETEKLLHGTPSGVDNTVIAYEQPVYFIKGTPPQTFTVATPLHLLIADTGLHSPTKITVGDVRKGWEKDPAKFNALFEEIGELVRNVKAALSPNPSPMGRGEPARPLPLGEGRAERGVRGVGQLLTHNHHLLREMGVSCAELDTLVEAALNAGALGAKLSGGGRGGNMIALVEPNTQDVVNEALLKAGAKRVLATALTTDDGRRTTEALP